jgi:hypothetical protein
MSDSHNENNQLLAIDSVNHAVIAHANAIEAISTLERLCIRRMGIQSQCIDAARDPSLNVLG